MDVLVEVDAKAFAYISGVVVPLLVALFSRLGASSAVKALLNLFLAAVVGVLANVVDTGPVEWQGLVVGSFGAWLTSIVSYYGLWEHVGVTPAIRQKTAQFGVGKPQIREH